MNKVFVLSLPLMYLEGHRIVVVLTVYPSFFKYLFTIWNIKNSQIIFFILKNMETQEEEKKPTIVK